MYSVNEIIIVEGVYDKNKLSTFIDGIVFATGGFSIMKDEERLNGLIKMIEGRGAVIFTDSDSAGFRIRNFLKQKIPSNLVKHAYIPEIYGKERRKTKPGAEGIMGVEGMTEEIIINALKECGCILDSKITGSCKITTLDLYKLGLSGRENSTRLRTALLAHLGLPSKLSSKMLCEFLSLNYTPDKVADIIEKISSPQ